VLHKNSKQTLEEEKNNERLNDFRLTTDIQKTNEINGFQQINKNLKEEKNNERLNDFRLITKTRNTGEANASYK